MIKRTRILLPLICIFLIVSIIITGCQPAPRPIPQEPKGEVPKSKQDDIKKPWLREEDEKRITPDEEIP